MKTTTLTFDGEKTKISTRRRTHLGNRLGFHTLVTIREGQQDTPVWEGKDSNIGQTLPQAHEAAIARYIKTQLPRKKY